MSSIDKLNEIRDRVDKLFTPTRDLFTDRAKEISDDMLYLLQAIEVRDQQIAVLTDPEYLRRLFNDFSKLSDTRRVLVLELLKEMSPQ